MKEPIQKYFQVGTIQWMTHPPVSYPVCDSVRTICCDPYFGALEITHIPDSEARERVKKMLDQSHLRVCYGAAEPAGEGAESKPSGGDGAEEGGRRADPGSGRGGVYGGRGYRFFGRKMGT